MGMHGEGRGRARWMGAQGDKNGGKELRLFEKETMDDKKTYQGQQYIHISSVKEVEANIKTAGFEILETNGKLQISKEDVRAHPPVFYVCKKIREL